MAVMVRGLLRPSAAIIQEGSVLVVRTTRRDRWYLPGGKPKSGESELDALVREVEEETSLAIGKLALLKRFEGVADSTGEYLNMPLYGVGEVAGQLAARGEIEQARWVNSQDFYLYNFGSVVGGQVLPWMFEEGLIT